VAGPRVNWTQSDRPTEFATDRFRSVCLFVCLRHFICVCVSNFMCMRRDGCTPATTSRARHGQWEGVRGWHLEVFCKLVMQSEHRRRTATCARALINTNDTRSGIIFIFPTVFLCAPRSKKESTPLTSSTGVCGSTCSDDHALWTSCGDECVVMLSHPGHPCSL
jgi:hypothetical protein